MDLLLKFHQTLNKELKLMWLKLFHKIGKNTNSFHYFYVTETWQQYNNKENDDKHRWIILNKFLPNELNNTLKISYSTIKLTSLQECNNCSTYASQYRIIQHIGRFRNKSHTIVSIDAENAFAKVLYFFMI